MMELIESFKCSQNRCSTILNYQVIWRHFNRFILSLDVIPDLWEESASLFAAHLVHEGVQSSTLKSYVSVIKFTLSVDGYEWNDELVKLNIMARACRLKNDRIRVRLPIKKIFLEIILFKISRMFHGDDKKGPQPYLEKMYLSLLLLGYYGMMRIGELTKGEHTLRAKDIHIGFNKKKLLLILFTSKTHGCESQPQEIKITANSLSKQQNEDFSVHFKQLEIMLK